MRRVEIERNLQLCVADENIAIWKVNAFSEQFDHVFQGGDNRNVRVSPSKDFLVYTQMVEALPKYLRLEGDDHWCLAWAGALIYVDDKFEVAYLTPDSMEKLWMGPTAGRVCHLTEAFRDENRIQALRSKHVAPALGR